MTNEIIGEIIAQARAVNIENMEGVLEVKIIDDNDQLDENVLFMMYESILFGILKELELFDSYDLAAEVNKLIKEVLS